MMILLLPKHAHSLVIARLRRRAAQSPTDQVQAWCVLAHIKVESQQLYGNFRMRKNVMLQAIGEAYG